eukprot:SAG11_NODE_824_length_6993_cov_1.875290_2_plen_78_part_00
MAGPQVNVCVGATEAVHALSFRVLLLPAVRHRCGDDAGDRAMPLPPPTARCVHVVLLVQLPRHSPAVEPVHDAGPTH